MGIFSNWYFEHYILLCNSKNFNGKIPASEIKSYFEMIESIDPPETFLTIITSIDFELGRKNGHTD